METIMNMERSHLEKWRALPKEKQQEVLSFVEAIAHNLQGSKDGTAAEAIESATRPSMQEIARLTVAERHKILAPYIAATAEDFLTDPELTFPFLMGKIRSIKPTSCFFGRSRIFSVKFSHNIF